MIYEITSLHKDIDNIYLSPINLYYYINFYIKEREREKRYTHDGLIE